MQSGKHKLGKFFVFVGLILLVVFFAINQAEHPAYSYFCAGAVVVILGALMMRGGHQQPAESMRFRTLRRWREQQKQRRAARNKQPYEH